MKNALLLFCIFTIISTTTYSRDFPIPGASITLPLPEPWRPMAPSIVKDYNEDMLSKRPQSTARYIAGFTRGPVPAGEVVGTDYIWIQRTPMVIAPEQLLALIPKTLEKHKKTFDDLLKKEIKASEVDAPYFDQKAGVIVLPSSATRTDGQKILSVAYLLPLRSALISITVQSAPEHVNMVLTEAHIAVSGLTIEDDAKPTTQWQEKLKQLLGK
jgi:hypothetical protein